MALAGPGLHGYIRSVKHLLQVHPSSALGAVDRGGMNTDARAGDEDTPGLPWIQVFNDDLGAAQRWCEALNGEGVSTHCAFAPPAETSADGTPPLAVVLHLSGHLAERLDTLRALRAGHPRLPLLVVCQRLRDLDHVLALEMGADDVQDSSTSATVLAARLRALARRHRDAPAPDVGPDELSFGRLTLKLRERRVTLAGEDRPLTEGEFEVLWLLALSAGQPVSRADLLRRLRGLPYQRIDRSIDCRVYRIRGKLGDVDGPSQRIRTMRNCGYLFSSAPW
jgi:DNA-binding response OmpR family regulator